MATAVFLGAGASRAFGYPLTSELLPRILTRLDDNELFHGTNTEAENAEDRAWFRQRLFAFLPGLADARAAGDLGVGITDLLTLVDRALVHGEARAGLPPEELARFRALLERAVYEALMRDTARRTGHAVACLDRFADWLLGLPEPPAVVTTNYDGAVDHRVFAAAGRTDRRKHESRVGEAVDLGFAWRSIKTGGLVSRPARPRWQVLKLHGSVNWLRCPLCGQIYVNVHGPIGTKAFARTLDEFNTCHCNDWTRLRLHLVTPSLIRTYQDPHLLGIWQAALEALRTADRWVIIGYSLPAEDVSIRSLFLRAWDGHASAGKPRVTVVQRTDPRTEATYRAFFPASSLDYRSDGLEAFLTNLEG